MSSYLSSHADVTDPRFTGHVWRDNEDKINATVDIAPKVAAHASWLCFDDPAVARAFAAACIEAAEAMERLEAEGDADRTAKGDSHP